MAAATRTPRLLPGSGYRRGLGGQQDGGEQRTGQGDGCGDLLRCVIQSIDLATDDHQPARWHFRLDGTDYLAERSP
jgi:hypothetical protein